MKVFNRHGKILMGITISLSFLTTVGSMLINPTSAHAETTQSYSKMVFSASKTVQADRLISTAESYMGKVKYGYGERDIQHLILDCSSFTQLVFKHNGISIPWGSKAQTSVGTPVTNKANLKKGDLVMFSVGTPGRINHVGIYMGNGMFISNTSSSGVVIRDMNSGYWKNRFITGRHL
ncbi:C40 family peptidase [Paenibacillus aestuarii]|uniref:C40 family peptidase n=1 Tax=Paenibacillus aestuarii TaxID=516965 RepID=A0ABW0K9H0_9BACL|nr:C40 family peptidase [Paenibacillus aestuarii]